VLTRLLNLVRHARWQAWLATFVMALPLLAWAQPAASDAAAWPEASAAPYWKRSREGWFWGETPEQPVRVVPPPAPAASSAAPLPNSRRSPAVQQDLDAFEAFKREFEDSINAATQNPSEENVARFLELYAQARAKASVFSDTAQAVAVRMPWLDESNFGARPTLRSAMAAYDSITQQDRDQLLREMAQSYGLYFFFRKNCAYCHLQAPQLKAFQEKYGFTVYAVSLDGGVLPDFPHAVRDNGLMASVADTLKIPQQHFVVPALVLARPSTREVVPIGFGAMNMSQMVDRIALASRVRDRSAGMTSHTSIHALTGQVPQVSAIDRAARGALSTRGLQP
jgi:conjugal transfer pilus assembly protein TraF